MRGITEELTNGIVACNGSTSDAAIDRVFAAFVAFLAMALRRRAEHAKINLDVTVGRETATAHVDQTPPDSGKNPRPVVKAKVNEPIRIKYLLTNVYPHKTLENVVVHFYVARQDKVGQKELPDLKGDVVTESAFDMDFKPGGKAGQRTTLKIDTPGRLLDPRRNTEHPERPRAFLGHRPGGRRRGQVSHDSRPRPAENRPDEAMARLRAGPSVDMLPQRSAPWRT